MKSEKKKKRKKIRTKKQKRINAFGEIIYNCPYLILVVTTSLAVMIFSDEIGIKAIASEAGSTVRLTMGTDTYAEESDVNLAVEDVVNEGGILENADTYNLENMENEGKRKEEDYDIKEESEQQNDNKNGKNSENTDDIVKGVTRFELYEPVETDSHYYSDAGKIALTTEYPYKKEDISYFKDAVFLGDSRTLGISDYAGLDETDFYCDSGMTIFKLLEDGGVTYQKTGNKENIPSVMQQKKYGKIYIMLGMNELGYGNTEMYLEQYRKVVDQIREWQPDAIIYIMANLHVSREKNNFETEFNNININDKNAASALLANGTDIFYLDVNPIFTDSEGFLNAELSFDGVHLYAQHYDKWREFLLEHAVEPKVTTQDSAAAGTGVQDSMVSRTAESDGTIADQAPDTTGL